MSYKLWAEQRPISVVKTNIVKTQSDPMIVSVIKDTNSMTMSVKRKCFPNGKSTLKSYTYL